VTAYTKGLAERIETARSKWDLSERLNRRELRRMRVRLWWHGGPSTLFAAVVGSTTGLVIGWGLYAWLVVQ
jgi:hypothetical protein